MLAPRAAIASESVEGEGIGDFGRKKEKSINYQFTFSTSSMCTHMEYT